MAYVLSVVAEMESSAEYLVQGILVFYPLHLSEQALQKELQLGLELQLLVQHGRHPENVEHKNPKPKKGTQSIIVQFYNFEATLNNWVKTTERENEEECTRT